jgi:hypothetical protein
MTMVHNSLWRAGACPENEEGLSSNAIIVLQAWISGDFK